MTGTEIYDFTVGDVLVCEGETYQVHRNDGSTGLISLFPSVDVSLLRVEWQTGYRKIGHANLPAPTPCMTGGCVLSDQAHESKREKEHGP